MAWWIYAYPQPQVYTLNMYSFLYVKKNAFKEMKYCFTCYILHEISNVYMKISYFGQNIFKLVYDTLKGAI